MMLLISVMNFLKIEMLLKETEMKNAYVIEIAEIVINEKY